MMALRPVRLQWNPNFIRGSLIRLALWKQRRSRRASERARHPNLAPPLNISWRNKELVARHWLEGRRANRTRKVAWVTSGAPVEPLKALGYYVVYPENHAALCGTARVAVELCEQAESAGYSGDICSYARTDIGSVLSGKTPVGRLPKPDLLMACTNICQTVLSWYRVLERTFEAPLVLIDTPFIYYDQATEHARIYVRAQMEDAIEQAERIAGRSLDIDSARETTRLSRMATDLWLEILERNSHQPAPISVFDQFILMAPIVEMRGEAKTVDFYADMLKEVDERIANGVGAVKNERKRLLWDNLPIWYRLRYLADTLGERGIALVASTYTNAWAELAPHIDPEKPFESMTNAYMYPILNRGTGHKLATMRGMIDRYQLDGVILHSDRSCKPYSVGQMDQRDRLIRAAGTPSLLLEADHNDSRAFAEAQVANRLEAFVEMLEA